MVRRSVTSSELSEDTPTVSSTGTKTWMVCINSLSDHKGVVLTLSLQEQNEFRLRNKRPKSFVNNSTPPARSTETPSVAMSSPSL